jgi:ABC-type Fe3+ transport system permease subunit
MDTFHLLFITWAAVTAVLVCAMIYRGTLNNHEEDHLALGAGEQTLADEQRAIVGRIEKLSRASLVLGILSGVLLAVIGVMWLWQNFQSF